jgi:hypothetical protein
MYRQGFRADLEHVALGFIAEGNHAGIIKGRGISLSTERRRQIATGAGFRRGQSPASRNKRPGHPSGQFMGILCVFIDLVRHSDTSPTFRRNTASQALFTG